MAIEHVADAHTINTSSSTTNTVTKPAGTVDGDVLVGVYGQISQTPVITDPGALVQLGEQDDGANTRTRGYMKLAAGEGADYMWSLTSAIKNVAWLGTYRGVDPADPVADWASAEGTSGSDEQTTPAVDVPEGGWLVTAVVTRHAPGGAGATTWDTGEAGDAERWDAASNAGSADITVAVWDSDGPLPAGSYSRTLTASAAEGQVALWSVALRPANLVAASTAPFSVGVPVF